MTTVDVPGIRVMREEFHGNHDQSDHGNWADGSDEGWEPLGGRVRSDRSVEYNEAGDRYRVAAADGTMIEAAVYALGYDAERRLRSATWKQRTVDVLNGTVDGYDRAPTDVPPMVMVLSEFPFGMPDNASRAVAMVHSDGEVSDSPPSSDSPFAVGDIPGNAVVVNGTLNGEQVWDVFKAGAEKAMMPAVKQGLARYTGAHEYGHTRMAAGVDSQATLITLWDEIRPQTLSFDPEWKATSPYGRTNPAEAHAEAFAEWAIGDPQNPLAAYYADRLGWGDPNEDALAAAAGRSGDRYEWLFDGPDGPAAIVDGETTTYPLDDTTATFHLQGQHDQQTHAGGRAASGEIVDAGHAVYDTLDNGLSGEENRAALRALSPAAKAAADGVDLWTSTFDGVRQMRADIDDGLESAVVFRDVVRNAPSTMRRLYRGMDEDGMAPDSADEIDWDSLAVGDRINVEDIGSFSEDPDRAADFGNKMLIMAGAKHALPIAGISIAAIEQEWLVAGQLEIVSTTRTPGGGHRVEVTQVDDEVGMVASASAASLDMIAAAIRTPLHLDPNNPDVTTSTSDQQFHLQGQHDQQSHAGDRAGSGLTVDSRALRPGSAVFTDEYGTLDIRSTGVARIRQAVFEYEGGNDAFEVVFIEDDGEVTGADVYGMYGDQNTVEGEQALVAWLAETGIDDVTWDGDRASKHATPKAAMAAGEADARERLAAKVQDVYSGEFDVGGRSYTIGDVNTTSPQGVLPIKTDVSGSIYDTDGVEMGTFSRSVYEDGTVFNHALNISVGEQGKGIGTAFLDQTEAGLGATEYRVGAVSVGKYAWAARGYQLDAGSGSSLASFTRDRWVNEARALIGNPQSQATPFTPEITSAAEAVFRSWSDDIGSVYPADLLAVDPRFKTVFLNGPSWDGVRRVGDPRTANLAVETFHLQGQHDQQTHAGGGTARPLESGWSEGGFNTIQHKNWGSIDRADWDAGVDSMPVPATSKIIAVGDKSVRLDFVGYGSIEAVEVHSPEFWRATAEANRSRPLAAIRTTKVTRDGVEVREVQSIIVEPKWRGKDIATEMWKFGKDQIPNIAHSIARTDDGKAWIDSLERQGLAVEGVTVFRFDENQPRVPAGSSGGGRWGGGGRDGRPIPPPPGKARPARRGRPAGVLPDVPFSDVRIAYRPRHPDGKADPGEIVWAKIPFEEDASQSKDRPVLIIGRTADGKNLVGVQLTSKPGRSSDDRLPVGSGDWDKNGRESYLKLDRFVQVDDANYRREGAYVKKDAFQTVVDELTERQGVKDVELAAGITVFRFDPGQARDDDGRWTSIGGGSIGSGVADRIATGETIRTSPSEVAGIVATFADITEGTVDLTAVDVDGYPNLFSEVRGNTIGRADMPQIPRVHIDGFRDQLAEQGVGFVDDTVNASTLSATQNELDGVAVARMIERIQDGSFGSAHRIMVSSDGRILDGHHRWAAAAIMELDGDPAASPVDVVRIDLPIDELLDQARTYNAANGVAARTIGDRRVSFSNASMSHLSSEMHQLSVGCDDSSCSPPPFGTGGSNKDPATIQAEVDTLSKAQRSRYTTRRGETHEEAMMRAVHGGSDNSGLHEATAEERKALGVAPGMRYVMVANSADGNRNGLVARGVAPNGQVQSTYSEAHSKRQAEAKYERQADLHRAMPKLDKAIAEDATTNPDAAAVQVMRATGIRIDSGGGTAARGTRSGKATYGASSLEARHVTVSGDEVRIRFEGKGSKPVDITVNDPALASTMNAWKSGKSGSDRLFDTNAASTDDYIDRVTGSDFKNHDIRTYKANTIAMSRVAALPKRYPSQAALERARKTVGVAVSDILGNTPSTSLKSYINPAVFNDWEVEA